VKSFNLNLKARGSARHGGEAGATLRAPQKQGRQSASKMLAVRKPKAEEQNQNTSFPDLEEFGSPASFNGAWTKHRCRARRIHHPADTSSDQARTPERKQ